MSKKNLRNSCFFINNIFKLVCINIILFNLCSSCLAADNSNLIKDKSNIQKDPVQFLHSITDQVLTELKSSHDAHKNIKEINRIVDNFIMPNVDFDEMCQWIAGRAVWAKSPESQRLDFIKQLKQLLIKTYSTTLNNYSQEKIEFQHYSGDLTMRRIQIKSTVIRPNKENLAVDYRLIAKEDSWKVYDLIIEGVSILQGFRAQFSDDIKRHGLVSVTNKIREHNNHNV